MSRLGLRGVVAVVAVLICGRAFATAYTSNNTGGGTWNNAATWNPAGIPGPGDTVTITGSDTVTLGDTRTVASVMLDSTSGNKTLDVTGGGNLTITAAGNALVINAPPLGMNLVQMSGGSIDLTSGDVSIVGGISSVAKIGFTSAGTISTRQLLFSGNASNAQVDFGGVAGEINISINLGAGGTIFSAGSTFTFDGGGGQTINSYTFHNLVINKAVGTAALNGPITVNGDLDVTSGVLDDGGNQISLNAGTTSNVTIGANGVLKLGSSGIATFFPQPVAGGNVTMSPNAAVVYQSGANSQSVNIDVTYRRLFLQAPGSTGPVDKAIGSGIIDVDEFLQIDDNGANGVRLLLGPETLDVEGDISGDGEILITSGSIFVGGNFASTITFTLAGTGSTVTYDGAGAQSVLGGANYDNLVVNKASGVATISGPLSLNNDLTISGGTLDDDGIQILLDSGNGSSVSICSTCVLKLGSATTGTNFPSPVISANVTLASGSTVIYQAGVPQTIDTSFNYANLSLLSLAGNVVRSFVNQAFSTVLETFHIGANVTATFDNDILDVNGDITGPGTVQLIDGIIDGQAQVGGDWTSGVLIAEPGSTVTYDGSGPQIMLPATYARLEINKPSGVATAPSGTTTVQELMNFTNGNVDIVGNFTIESGASVTRISGHFLGPLTMDLDGTATRRFHVGTASSYLPVDAEGSNAGSLTLQAVEGLHPNKTGTNTLFRYWRILAPSTVTTLDSVQFNYNDPGDINAGDETKYHLAHYSGGTWTDYGDIPEALDYGSATSGAYLGDWVIGQKGSTGFAGKLAITSVNGGNAPGVNVGFPVEVESQHDDGTPANVTVNTGVDILEESTGAGTLLGGFATINAGTSSATASDSTFDAVESNVQLKADASSGDTTLEDGVSALFDVVALPPVLTVTNLLDAGAGSLREAITTFNGGGCAIPCAIEFDAGGTGNIVLATALPAITGTGPLTINGYSGVGALVNTANFGQPLDSVITVSLDGNNAVAIGLLIQTPDVTVRGLGFRRFNFGGTGEAIKIDNVANCTISGNYIGTDNSGMSAQPNYTGVVLFGASATGNAIGGVANDDRNLIAGNASWGVEAANGANTNDLQGNYIGIGADAVTGLGNGSGGVEICATCQDNLVGTSTLGNVISGHTTGIGIDITGSDTVVSGNLIGTSADGSIAVPNLIGMFVTGDNNSIGGVSPSDRNLISGNSTDGIVISSNGNEIGGNWIGTDGTGVADLGNGGHGIYVAATAASNKIGFPQPNRIAFNQEGVELDTTGIGTTIRTNEIFSNSTAAIDLGADGLTANDAIDADTGANNLQNFPTISTAEINGGNVDVTVSLNSSGGVSTDYFIVDVYRADTSTPSQAAEHLGASGCIDTLLSGIFTNEIVSVPQGLLTVGGKVLVTATAYSDSGCATVTEGTSELSPSVTVNGDVHWINSLGGAWEIGGNWDSGFIPGPGDNVIIDAPGTYIVTLSSGQTIQSLTVGDGTAGAQTLAIATGPLTLNSASTVTSTGVLSAAANNNLQGTGSLTNNGTMSWSLGTMSIASVTNNTANFTIGGANPKTLNGTILTNSATGSMSWNSGALNFMNGGGINNAGTFLIAVDHIVGDAGSGGAFANSGTFTKQGVSGSTTFNVPFNHTGGQVNVQNGWLTLSGGGSATAPIDISATKKILVSSAYTFGAGVSLAGTGKVEVGAGGTLSVNTALTFPGLHLTGGTVNGTGDVSATTGGQISWDSGTFSTGGGKVSLAGSANLQISTPGSKTLNRTLELTSPTATAFWDNGTIDIGTSGLINNGGTFESQADTILNNSGAGSATFTNTGTFKKALGAGTTLFQNVQLISSGTLWVANGTVNLANATISGSVDIDAGKTLLVDSDAVTINSASFVDSGLLQVNGGTLTMNGPLAVFSFQFDSGLVNGIGNVSHGGPFQWNGGTLSGSGASAIITGGSLTIANAAAKTLDRTLTINSGITATWSGGTINLGTNGNISNIGTFIATTDETMNKSGGGTPTFTNSGTLRKNGGAAQTTFTNVDLSSTGTIHVQTGTLNPANASVSGIVDLDAGTKITVDSDIFTISGVTSFPDTGSLDVQGGALVVSNNVTVPALNFNSGTIDGASTLTIGTSGVWGGGTMQGSGATEVANLATLTMTGIGKALNTRTLRPLSGSTVNWNAGNLSMNTGGNIDNTGLFHVQFDGNIGNGGTAGGFVNNSGGTLRKSTTNGSLFLTGINLTNNGVLDIDLGKVDVTGTFVQGATGSLDILLGGVVPGTQHGQLVTNSGPTFAGPLNITFNGPYQPLANDDFTIVSWPSDTHVGNFAPYNLPALSNGRTWSNFFNATGLHLVVNAGNADVSIVKTASSPNVVVGNPISYTLAVSNAGPDAASGVQVTDTLPAGHTGIAAGGGPTWLCSVLGLAVTCNATAPLNTGAAPSITINANAPGTPGPITNTANITTTNPDPTPANDSSFANVTIDAAQADLAVSGSDPTGVPVGSPVAFTFNITNNGPQTATSIIFTAPIPGSLTFVSATPPCTFSVGTVSCNVGNLASAASTSVTINVTAPNVGTQSITGSADATETDPTAVNDSLTLSVAVAGGTVVVTNTNDSGAGSLRQAMLDAQNAVCTSPCFITFNITGTPPFVIQPATTLPDVASSTHIDGTTQPGYGSTPIVEINGSLLGSPSSTLVLSGTNATVTALSITNAVVGSKAVSITGNNNKVTASYIGVAPLGATAANHTGISITGSNNTIGGTNPFDANVIANNTTNGLVVTGAGIGNAILGNSFDSNLLLGIDLNADGVTTNDATDSDPGPNNLQNFPTITSATLDGLGGMTINSNINSSGTSAGSIYIEYFEADAGGEGKTFVTSVCVAGNNFGIGSSFAAPGFISAGDSIVATATAYSDAACTNVADGTSEFSNLIVVTNCTPPPATLTTPPSVCSNATNQAASVNAPTGVAFNWVATNATIVSGQGTNAITFNAGAGGTVNLSVTVTDNIGCVNTVSNNFPITAPPVVNITGPAATCASTPVTLDAGPGASWLWSTSETTQTIIVSPASTQIYSVTLTDANGCSASDTHTVNVSSNPTATITAPPSVCENSTGNNASVPTQAGATYAWTISNGVFTSVANGPSVVFTAGASGNVLLSVTITVGSCTSVGNSTVPIAPPPAVTITGPTAVCPSTPFTLSAGPGFSSYNWSNGATTPSIVVSQTLASQVYSVTVTNGAGCAATANHTVTLSGGPSAAITAPGSVLANTAGHLASVAAQAGATYFWAITNGAITNGQGTDTIIFSVGSAGTTQLSVEIALNGCSSTGTHNVGVGGPVSSLADAGITKSAAASVQAGGLLTYVLNVTNNGPGNAPLVTITDPLPNGTSLVSIDDGTFSCGSFAAGIVCNGSLFAGSSELITIVVNAPSNVPPQGITITNTASIDAGSNDTNAANDVASAQTVVIGAPVNCTTTPPSLLQPQNGASSSSPVAFSWSAVSGFVDAYELWIVTDEATSLAGTTTNTSLTIPLASGPTGWFVIARMDGDCPPLTSAQRTVNVALANGCATHTAPQLTSPAANSTLTSPVSFSWTPVPQAIGYRVWVEVNGTAAQDVGTTDGAIMLTADVPPGAIAAHVDALFSGCPDTHSSALPFNVARPDPCAGRTTVTPLAPANNATLNSSVVNFSWSEADADGYRLWVSINGAPAEAVATTNENSLQTTVGHGVVDWWIELLYDGCGSTESQHFRFTIPQRQSCATTAPQLLSPANNSTVTDANVTFNWTSVPDAVSYELWLSVGNTTPTLIGTTSNTSLTRLVAHGKLDWFVRAIVDRCPSRDSATARFIFTTPAGCRDDQPPHAIAPLPNANVISPVDFAWTPRPGATSYDLFTVRGNNTPQIVLSTSNAFANGVTLQTGKLRWFVRAHFAACSPLDSAERPLEIVGEPAACADLLPPVISAPGQISNDEPFLLQWNVIPGATAYQLQTANNSAFGDADLLTTGDTSTTLTRSNHGSTPLGVYARVRAIDTRCAPETVTPYGPTAAIFILPEGGSEGSTPLTGGVVTHFINLGPELAGQSFVVTVKEPWLSVAPSSGVVAAGGTALVITADTTDLPLGTSLGSVQIALTSSARGVATNATTFKIPTMSVSKVTPVTPAPKSTPPPDALIIPAVAHANGINSQFQSDVRVTNSSAQLLQYQATFTPSGGDGLAAGRQTTFSIDPGRTIALDDVLRGWFGTGGESVTGTLEIRPITETAPSTSSVALSGLPNLVTFAASRTFNVTANGTFGQYIPAIPFANFIGGSSDLTPPTALSLQQIAQSDRYRTNLGIVEASGDPVSLLVKVFGSDGQKLTEFPVQLAGGQHTQLNSFLTTQGVGSLADGRVEISVVGGAGKVTAYASVLDNATSDPLLVTPVTLAGTGNTKWVIPGVADLNNGIANWQTDMRLFNAGTTAVDAVLTFYSQNGGTPQTANVTIPAGQVRQFDKTISSLFNKTNDGGAVHIATSTASRLVATARTYNQTTGGTYGQFISGITPSEATGVGSRPLQILQVEESNRFRSNIGLAEVTGQPIKLEITVVPADTKISVVTEVQLQANEFRQINSLLRSVGLTDTYNARVSVRAIDGAGRVTAYASVIDMLTNDPTYVPAQ
jgi:uncharacterized repeat protein (TIGR01451 family)